MNESFRTPNGLPEAPTEVLASVLRSMKRRLQTEGLRCLDDSTTSQATALAHLTEASLNVHVSMQNDVPAVALGVWPNRRTNYTYMALRLADPDDREAVLGHLSEADFRELLQYGALMTMDKYQAVLARSPQFLSGPRDELLTNGQYAQQELAKARAALSYVGSYPDNDLKKHVQYR